MSQQPAPTDKRGDVSEIGPEGREHLGDGGLDVIEGSEELIVDLVLELIKELLDGIKFRAVGRELEEVDALGGFVSTDLGMEAGSIPDDDMMGELVAFGHPVQEEVAGLRSRAFYSTRPRDFGETAAAGERRPKALAIPAASSRSISSRWSK